MAMKPERLEALRGNRYGDGVSQCHIYELIAEIDRLNKLAGKAAKEASQKDKS